MKLSKMITLAFIMWGLQAFSQPEIGVLGGLSIYSGDLSKEEFGFFLEDAQPAYGLFIRLPLSDRLSARLGVNAGELTSQDANLDRGLNFQTRITEVNLLAEFALFRTGRESMISFSPKIMAGFGVFRFDPEGFIDGEWVALQPLGTEGQGLPGHPAPYHLTHFNIPLGLQLEFNFGDRVKLGLEFGGRKLFTDYLDDIGSEEVVYREILEGNGPLAARLSNPNINLEGNIDTPYRRGGSYNDWYWISGVTIAFVLGDFGGGSGRGSGCYKF
jgi:hypothetical protein